MSELVTVLSSEEEALAIRKTRVEKVNTSLEKIRQAAIDGLPVWSNHDSDKAPQLIIKEYWERYGIETVIDLKQMTPSGGETPIGPASGRAAAAEFPASDC